MDEILKEFYYTNVTSTDKIVTLSKEEDCGIFVSVDTTQIAAAESTTKIEFPGDGVYNVYADGSLVGTAKYYTTLFESAMLYVSSALCGDFGTKCQSKGHCSNKDINVLNNAYSKLILYVANNGPKYDEALVTATTKVRCSSKLGLEDLQKKECLTGKSDASELVKIQLAHLYLEMYAVDMAGETAPNQIEMTALYNYESTYRCIRSIGIINCDTDITPLPGVLHTAEFSISPTSIRLGESNTVEVSYKLTANDDEFTAILDTNIPNVTLAKLNGFTQTETITGQTVPDTYYITYEYLRGTTAYQNTLTKSTTATSPQWFGGESTTDDFAGVGGLSLAATIKAAITNIAPVYQDSSNSSSSNTGTSGEYIWWITENPIQFLIGQFEIPVGPWNESCDPNSYAIIGKQGIMVMEDGQTEIPMYFYRTCPLQELGTQTLEYTLKEI